MGKQGFTSNAARGKRKKLWEIEGYHCSVIGTCFNRAELRKIARRKEFALGTELSDYQVHNRLVNLAAIKTVQSRALNKILDRKYHRSLERFAKIKTEQGLRELWQLYFGRGAVAGAYWALLTHPALSRELASEAHGEIHMIGHDFIGEYQREMFQVHKLRERLQETEDKLVDEKCKVREGREKLIAKERDEAALVTDNDRLHHTNESLRCRVLKLEARPVASDIAEIADLRYRLSKLIQDNARLLGLVDQLEDEVARAKEDVELAKLTAHELEKTNLRLQMEKKEFELEILSLEESVLGRLLGDCDECPEQGTGCCPGPGLCGKTVLYVGGLHRMIPHYRQLVEKHGGVFVHHDGGREVSRAVLPKMLCRADAVLCPIDCVSHDACLNVKKICKRYRKPFVMMRSSGLSSLAKGLTNIMHEQ